MAKIRDVMWEWEVSGRHAKSGRKSEAEDTETSPGFFELTALKLEEGGEEAAQVAEALSSRRNLTQLSIYGRSALSALRDPAHVHVSASLRARSLSRGATSVSRHPGVVLGSDPPGRGSPRTRLLLVVVEGRERESSSRPQRPAMRTYYRGCISGAENETERQRAQSPRAHNESTRR